MCLSISLPCLSLYIGKLPNRKKVSSFTHSLYYHSLLFRYNCPFIKVIVQIACTLFFTVIQTLVSFFIKKKKQLSLLNASSTLSTRFLACMIKNFNSSHFSKEVYPEPLCAHLVLFLGLATHIRNTKKKKKKNQDVLNKRFKSPIPEWLTKHLEFWLAHIY